ncbi:hypothetical protein HK405_009395 [Cladochytrium tenue]|nr:hypothetical protein HK405_009395 [Cladochytrium tenue]
MATFCVTTTRRTVTECAVVVGAVVRAGEGSREQWPASSQVVSKRLVRPASARNLVSGALASASQQQQ